MSKDSMGTNKVFGIIITQGLVSGLMSSAAFMSLPAMAPAKKAIASVSSSGCRTCGQRRKLRAIEPTVMSILVSEASSGSVDLYKALARHFRVSDKRVKFKIASPSGQIILLGCGK
jgi:hypothetical protein